MSSKIQVRGPWQITFYGSLQSTLLFWLLLLWDAVQNGTKVHCARNLHQMAEKLHTCDTHTHIYIYICIMFIFFVVILEGILKYCCRENSQSQRFNNFFVLWSPATWAMFSSRSGGAAGPWRLRLRRRLRLCPAAHRGETKELWWCRRSTGAGQIGFAGWL